MTRLIETNRRTLHRCHRLAAVACGLVLANTVHAQALDGSLNAEASPVDWASGSTEDEASLAPLSREAMAQARAFSPLQRPRLSVALPAASSTSAYSILPYATPASDQLPTQSAPAWSWSLDAWQMNTASLAHIQCSSASRTIESFLAEDCRFVDQPTPSSAVNLVEVEGRWMAAPGLQVGFGAFSGQQTAFGDGISGVMGGPVNTMLIPGVAEAIDQVDGVSMNLSFGLQAGRIGDLILDLELSRYRRTPDSFSARNGLLDWTAGGVPMGLTQSLDNQYQTAGQLGLGWRKDQFSADLIGQYRELPYWFGPDASGEGFNSFDIEFSWRAPINTSISVGVSNLLDSRPDASTLAEGAMEDSMDTIYGRIPYVRFQHDL
ncbi:MAG: hypothetical protein AAGH65_06240 [Pseudomonadota bacterium]